MNTRGFFLFVFIMAIFGSFVWGDTVNSRVITVPGSTLAKKLQWLAANAADNTGYLVRVTAANEKLTPHYFSYGGKNIIVRLQGSGNEKVISFSGNGSLFTINNGATLILDNITLTGTSNNNNALVRVNAGGNLQLNTGAKIAGNTGGGIYNNGGTITMTGGEISGNSGGGLRNDISYTSIDREYVTVNGTFTMTGGKISGNTITSSTGGGVYNNGIFTMTGGEISGNTGGGVHNNRSFTMTGGKISGNMSSSFDGGGIHNGAIYTMLDGAYVAMIGTFTMNGGEISGNFSTNGGGVSNYGTFTMSNGTISGNTCSIGGGVDNHGTMTMRGGTISGNAASLYGGGVSNSVTYTYTFEGYTSEGIFTMNDGEISGNTASSYGGGVFIGNQAVLNKTGGSITGYIRGDNNSNIVRNNFGIVQNDQGHSVYTYHDNSAYIKHKETTDGPRDVLSYNGKSRPPVWSGKWDN